MATAAEIYSAAVTRSEANMNMPRSDYDQEITHQLLAQLIKSVDDLTAAILAS